PGAPLPGGASPLALPGTGLTTVSFSPQAALAAYRFDPNVNGDILRKGWEVNEKITTLFTKADLETELFGLPMRGNVGVQIVRSDQSSTAPVVDNTAQSQFVFRTDGKTYTDFLPSANLIFDLKGDQIVRVGVGRQMARPRMDQLTAFSRTEVNTQGEWTGSGGNPRLDPYRATALDVSYEKYFGTKGYVSAALFHKDLSSWILPVPVLFDFTGFPNLGGNVPLSPIGVFTQPRNLKGGRLTGDRACGIGAVEPAVAGAGRLRPASELWLYREFDQHPWLRQDRHPGFLERRGAVHRLL
ncbi:MAG: TonB-dependent receptor, partial [Nitrospiraceae bacterium]|nr:TonB-dependent receptor [Nitrospiraceae bacterium]